MKNYDQLAVMTLKKQLKEKKKTKNNINLIDSGFVLRILLEFYRVERKNRYKLLKEAFMQQSSFGAYGKLHITFHSFKKIIELNYPNTPDSETAELYRDTYALGSGAATIDCFFTVA